MVERNSATCLFTLARSQLTLRRRLRSWRRLTEIVQTARCRCRKNRRRRPGDDQDRSKFLNYEILCLKDQAKPLEKHLFAVRSSLLRWHCFFSYYKSQWLLFSHMKNNFSTTLTPTEKPRYTHWRVFIVDSYYSKTIDIIITKYWFSIFKQGPMCKAGHPDNGAILQVAF